MEGWKLQMVCLTQYLPDLCRGHGVVPGWEKPGDFLFAGYFPTESQILSLEDMCVSKGSYFSSDDIFC